MAPILAAMIAAVPSVGTSAAYPEKRVPSLNRKVAKAIVPSPAYPRAKATHRGCRPRREAGTSASNPPSASSQPRVSVEK